MNLSYGNLADLFQRSFLGGRFKDFLYLGGNVAQYVDLKINEKAPPIKNASVVYNQEGYTVVIDGLTNEKYYIIPLTEQEYSTWKEIQHV